MARDGHARARTRSSTPSLSALRRWSRRLAAAARGRRRPPAPAAPPIPLLAGPRPLRARGRRRRLRARPRRARGCRRGIGLLAAALLAARPGRREPLPLRDARSRGCSSAPRPRSLLALAPRRGTQRRRGRSASPSASPRPRSTPPPRSPCPCLLAVWLRAARAARRPRCAGHGGRGRARAGRGLACCSPGPAPRWPPACTSTDARLLRPERAAAFVRPAGRALRAPLGAARRSLAGRRWPRRGVRGRAARGAGRDRRSLAAAALAGFLLGTPFAALEPRAFLSDLAFNDQTRFEYKGLTGASTSFGAYLGLAARRADRARCWSRRRAGAGRGRRARRCRATALRRCWSPARSRPTCWSPRSGHQALRFLAPAFPAAAWSRRARRCSRCRPPPVRRAVGRARARRARPSASLLVVRLFFVDSRAPGRALAGGAHRARRRPSTSSRTTPATRPPIPPGRTLRVVPTLSREMAPADRFAEAAAALSGGGVAVAGPHRLLLRALPRPSRAAPGARRASSATCSRAGAASRSRRASARTGWRRPAAEFVDPEIVVLRRQPAAQIPTSVAQDVDRVGRRPRRAARDERQAVDVGDAGQQDQLEPPARAQHVAGIDGQRAAAVVVGELHAVEGAVAGQARARVAQAARWPANVDSSMSLLNCTTKRLFGGTSASPSSGSAKTMTGGTLRAAPAGGGGALASAVGAGRRW